MAEAIGRALFGVLLPGIFLHDLQDVLLIDSDVALKVRTYRVVLVSDADIAAMPCDQDISS